MNILIDAISKGCSVLIENLRKLDFFSLFSFVSCCFFPFLFPVAFENFLNFHKIENRFSFIQHKIDESIDTPLLQIFERNIVSSKSGGSNFMLCANQLIEYNDNFRLYVTTCLPNPHYSPEIATKIVLIDFTLTESGVVQKMLTTIIGEERIDLQERKENHIIEMAKNNDLLYKLESNILEVLSSSDGNILEDENAINILSTSKTMSEEIQTKQITAVTVKKEIDLERGKYLMVASHEPFCIVASYA